MWWERTAAASTFHTFSCRWERFQRWCCKSEGAGGDAVMIYSGRQLSAKLHEPDLTFLQLVTEGHTIKLLRSGCQLSMSYSLGRRCNNRPFSKSWYYQDELWLICFHKSKTYDHLCSFCQSSWAGFYHVYGKIHQPARNVCNAMIFKAPVFERTNL